MNNQKKYNIEVTALELSYLAAVVGRCNRHDDVGALVKFKDSAMDKSSDHLNGEYCRPNLSKLVGEALKKETLDFMPLFNHLCKKLEEVENDLKPQFKTVYFFIYLTTEGLTMTTIPYSTKAAFEESIGRCTARGHKILEQFTREVPIIS